MATSTTNYSFTLPGVADPIDADLWGGQLNANWTSLDSLLLTASNQVTDTETTATVNIGLDDRNKLILLDATSNAITVNLLAAATAGDGFKISFKKTDSSSNAITIDGNASETIDGETTFELARQYDYVSIVCDGSNWFIISDKEQSIPSGAVIPFAFETPPTGFFECNGQAISRTTFADLFAAIGTVFGTGDGSTTFNLPDLRGEFVRGWDNGAGNDPNAGTRTDSGGGVTGDNVGTKQADEFKSHDHGLIFLGSATSGAVSFVSGPTTVENTQTGLRGGDETRPRNVYLMYCIKT